MPTPVVIDCDPGIDDAVALAAAAASDDLAIRAVTTVAGNGPIEIVTENARRVLGYCGAVDPIVASGCDRPLVRPLQTAHEVHGPGGLGGVDLPPTVLQPETNHAIDILRAIVIHHSQVTVIALGPLTNIALAIRRYPALTESIERIVVMGGAMAGGNVTPVAEFNIHTDPEAAAIVLSADLPITLVGLDVTEEATLGADDLSRLRTVDGEVVTTFVEMIAAQPEYDPTDSDPQVPVHDTLATLAAIEPTLLETEPRAVSIERCGTETTGMTVCAPPEQADASTTAVATALDHSRFLERLFALLKTYEAPG